MSAHGILLSALPISEFYSIWVPLPNQGNRKHNKYDYLVRKISVRSIIIRNYFGNYICHFIKIFYTFMYYNNTSSTSTYSILLHTQ